MLVMPAPLIRGTHSSHGHFVTNSMVGSSGLISRVLKASGGTLLSNAVKLRWDHIFKDTVVYRKMIWPEGEGVLLCVDDVSVFASLSVFLFVVHLWVLCVLWACWVSVIPATHQVQTPCSITASLGQESSSKVEKKSVECKQDSALEIK